MVSQMQLMICILIILQMLSIKCVNPPNNTDKLRMELKNTFNYDILENDVAGRVLIWKITSDAEKSVLQVYKHGRFKMFRSDETYLLLAKKSLNKTMVHYWVGAKAPQEKKMMVAKYAVTLFTLIHQYYNSEQSTIMFGFSLPSNKVFISREQEFLVSEAFKHTINLFKGTIQVSDSQTQNYQFVDTQFISTLPNLYVLRGNNDSTSIKKVPILNGLKWLSRNDTCLVLETIHGAMELPPINVFCGAEISQRAQLVAWPLGEKFDIYIVPSGAYPYTFNITKSDSKWKKMIEILEDSYFYKFYEIDTSDDHLKNTNEFIHNRFKKISIYKITNEGSLKQVSRTNTNIKMFDNRACYIFDTASAAGLFFILGRRTGVPKRVLAIQIMEYYMHSSFSFSPTPTQMRIIDDVDLDAGSFLIDLLINFDDWAAVIDIDDDDDDDEEEEE